MKLTPLEQVAVRGFDAALLAQRFIRARRQVWVRTSNELIHNISIVTTRRHYDIQWGVISPESVPILWGIEADSSDVGQAVFSGSPADLVAGMRSAFDRRELETGDINTVISETRSALLDVVKFLDRFSTRRDLRRFLLLDTNPKDSRGFFVPSNLPLKLLTAATLAAVDRDVEACELARAAEAALEPFQGETSRGRLTRLKDSLNGLCN